MGRHAPFFFPFTYLLVPKSSTRSVRTPFSGLFEYLKNALSANGPSKYGDRMCDVSDAYRKEIPGFPFVCAYVAHPYSSDFAADLKLFKYRGDRAVAYGFEE